mmetsp:Transcript_36214/g.61218  ORF Transcript_36214/g.61218 Transcript_36214/m.61218 type:complete len:94 (-) Transcript_36214:580-861(-)
MLRSVSGCAIRYMSKKNKSGLLKKLLKNTQYIIECIYDLRKIAMVPSLKNASSTKSAVMTSGWSMCMAYTAPGTFFPCSLCSSFHLKLNDVFP